MSNGELSAFMGHWLPRIEEEMRAVLALGDETVSAHYGMMNYHLGWADETFQPQSLPSGKRLRPVLCLLSCSEVGGDPVQALPAAAGIELLHNFSLIHDDIEDGDTMRRHRPTVWKVWGKPQAINVGDGMYTLAYLTFHRLPARGVDPAVALAALEVFTETCVALTEGQYLDMSFETRTHVTVAEYMRMIQGKTASLVGASVAVGALIGGAETSRQTDLMQFGHATGLAFQIQDDILGIWGDPAVTGKAAGNDILRRKKSLPLLYALNHPIVGERLQAIFANDITPDHLPAIMDLLDQADTREFSETEMHKQHELGVAALTSALGDRAASSPLMALSDSLLHRSA
jgi:geranylgeranyl diphosphate synthase, type I